MPSSTSSSERTGAYAGVAQPVPERVIPVQPLGLISIAALGLLLVLLTAWEWHMRTLQLSPGDLADIMRSLGFKDPCSAIAAGGCETQVTPIALFRGVIYGHPLRQSRRQRG